MLPQVGPGEFEQGMVSPNFDEAPGEAVRGDEPPPSGPMPTEFEPGASNAPPQGGGTSDGPAQVQVDPGLRPDGAMQGADPGPQRLEPEDLMSIGERPVGAAEQSNRGPSDNAGLGVAALAPEASADGLIVTEYEGLQVSAELQDGSRIRVEIAPESATPGGVSAVGGSFGRSGAGSAQPVDRDYVPAARRDLAARYFERLTQ
jgi:hypothetical protein